MSEITNRKQRLNEAPSQNTTEFSVVGKSHANEIHQDVKKSSVQVTVSVSEALPHFPFFSLKRSDQWRSMTLSVRPQLS